MKDFFEEKGTFVASVGANIQTRVGAKIFKGSDTSHDKKIGCRPYIALNWLSNSNVEKVQLNKLSHDIAGSRNVGELKIGLETKTNKKGQIWANLAYQLGTDSYKNLMGNLGLKWSF